MRPPGKLIWPAWLRSCVARWVRSTVSSARCTRGTSTAAGRGAGGKYWRNFWLSAALRPGTRQSPISWCGLLPARRARMICAQSAAGSAEPRSAGKASAPAAGAALDAATRELGRIEQPGQLLARQVGHGLRDLEDRLAFGVGLLRDRGALLVADHGIERRHQDRVLVQGFGQARLVHGEAADGTVGERARGIAQDLDALQQVVGDQGQHHVQPEVPRLPGHGDGDVVADDLRGHHRRGLGNHRVDLARHDAAARLQRRQRNLAQTRQRAAVHPAQVIGDFHEADRDHLELPGELHRGVLGRHGLEVIGCRGERHARDRRELGAETLPELRVRIDAGAHGGAALRQLQQARLCGLLACKSLFALGAPAGELLLQRHRHGIHQVRAPGLHDALNFRLLDLEYVAQVRKRRDQRIAQGEGRAHVHRGRDRIVAALPHVDVVIGVHRGAEAAAGERGDHLVGVHVGARARAGLEHVDRKMSIVLAGDHLGGGRLDGLCDLGIEQLQCRVGPCRRLLDEAERADEGARQLDATDREVLDRALGLGAPQGLGGHLQLAHAVVLDPKGTRHASLREGGCARPDDRMRYDANPSTSRAKLRMSGSANEPLSALDALAPVDGRYRAATAPLRGLLSESGLIRERIRIEAAWLLHLAAAAPQLPGAALSAPVRARAAELARAEDAAAPTAVKAIEARINHDVKAVEYYVRNELQEAGATPATLELVHFGCTSEDINNLSYARLLAAARVLLQQTLSARIGELTQLAHRYADTAMPARTHGQSASPTTLGKECANFAARLKRGERRWTQVAILGKWNGAVGNFNAHAAALPGLDWPKVAEQFVTSLGLEYNPWTTQIEPHDWIGEYCDALAALNVILIDLCRDFWGYISLGYLRQRAVAGEVGSSTMPHKVNPIDFENAEANAGNSSAFLEHLASKLMISRSRRAPPAPPPIRNMGVALGYSGLALTSARRGLGRVSADREVLAATLD